MILAGRGWGKTRTGAEWAIAQAMAKAGPGALIGRTAADVRDVMIEGPAGVLSISPPWFRPIYEPSKRRLTWPNGMTATAFSAEEPDLLRGPQHSWAWLDELAAWSRLEDTYSNFEFGLRLGDHPRFIVTTTPRPVPTVRRLMKDARTILTRGRTRDNFANLAPDFIASIEAKYAGTRLGRQELDGEVLEDVEGALWTRDMIEAARTGEEFSVETFTRVVVSVDPSGSDGEDAGDQQGIIAAGQLPDGRFAVIDDASCRLRPEGWALVVKKLYDRVQADRVVAEKNFGGDMVRAVIQAAAPNLPVRIVTASRGKAQRAEPISALYEQRKVVHVKPLPELEDQMCNFTALGYVGEGSPDRVDALVWALTDLAFGSPEPGIIVL